MQLGFDLEYTDPNTHTSVPWDDATPKLMAEIAASPWKIVDIETTGLTPASKEQNFSGRELRRGINPKLRLRVLSVYFPDSAGAMRLHAFDFDRLSRHERRELSRAALRKVVFGHNVNFDTFWLAREADFKDWRPDLLLDSMLLSRALLPEVPILFARMCDEKRELDETFRLYAEQLFKEKRSGWALADLSAVLLRKFLPKDMQGPKNWAEPFLTQRNYDYATGDVLTTYAVLAHVFKLEEGDDLLRRYYELRSTNEAVALVQPQVRDVVEMRIKGMPWRPDMADRYTASQKRRSRRYAKLLVAREENLRGEKAGLRKFIRELSNPDEGIKEELKQVLGEAFISVGITVDVTDKTGTFKIGEKDLRKAKALENEQSKLLFEPWVRMNRAKKAGKMALEISDFVRRSEDGRIHALTGHGPVTGRLSSSEPNCQQFPRDQLFRDCVSAAAGHKILASDYSALDMRVGAALAIRAQREILDAYMGDIEVPKPVKEAISRVIENRISLPVARRDEMFQRDRFEKHKARMKEVPDSNGARREFWDEYRKRQSGVKITHFIRCLAEVRDKARDENTGDWGSLRNAFTITGMDIHTWTALGMIGEDPMKLFGGLPDDDVAKELKKWKKHLGSKRQTGKVGNLSLLYAMQTLGLVDAASKNYNIHWTYDEADNVRVQWLDTYVEVDLWHSWTDLNPVETVYVPDPEKGGKYVKKGIYASKTLGNRMIYAFGLNAALAFQDQSTGADILGRVMHSLETEHNPIFKTIVNQVHDELVFEIANERLDAYAPVIERVMVDAAEHFLMPFGVRGECSPAIGDTWLKD